MITVKSMSFDICWPVFEFCSWRRLGQILSLSITVFIHEIGPIRKPLTGSEEEARPRATPQLGAWHTSGAQCVPHILCFYHTFHVPGSVLNAEIIFKFLAILSGSHYNQLHFTDEKTQAQRGWVTWPRSCSPTGEEPGASLQGQAPHCWASCLPVATLPQSAYARSFLSILPLPPEVIRCCQK